MVSAARRRTGAAGRAEAAAVAAANRGIITREQALAAGLGPSAIARLLAAGEWIEVHPGVYRVAAVPACFETDAMAAVRAAERRRAGGRERVAAASHSTAARLLGLERAQNSIDAPLEVTVSGPALPVLDAVTVHRTRALESRDIQRAGGVPATTGARTVIDHAHIPNEDLLPLVDDAVCQRVTSREHLHRRAVALRPGRPRVEHIVRVTKPGAEDEFRSWLERTTAKAFRAGGLPRPRWNVEMRDRRGLIGIVDALFDWAPLIVEVEGLRFHTQPAQRQYDAQRFNRLGAVARVLRYTYRDVLGRIDEVVAEVRETLDALTVQGTGGAIR